MNKTAAKPYGGMTKAKAGGMRRAGCTPIHAALVTAHFQAQHDLRSTCHKCGHPRTGTFAEVSGPCPMCEVDHGAR